jgi:hypothetical protein
VTTNILGIDTSFILTGGNGGRRGRGGPGQQGGNGGTRGNGVWFSGDANGGDGGTGGNGGPGGPGGAGGNGGRVAVTYKVDASAGTLKIAANAGAGAAGGIGGQAGEGGAGGWRTWGPTAPKDPLVQAVLVERPAPAAHGEKTANLVRHQSPRCLESTRAAMRPPS